MEPRCDVPPADSGRGSVGPENNWYKAWSTRIEGKSPVREVSPSIKLGLGISAGSGGLSHVTRQVKSAFTPVQLHELQQHALIFKYIVSGLPVPFHLLLPIWKSVSSSFTSANGGIYNQYPSFLGFSAEGFDYRSMMDPEPGRCRRTDGKKWRCSRDVVPDQKYCDRHMHRGRQRSRKHVEASENISKSDTTTTIASNNTTNSIDSSINVPANTTTTTKYSVGGNNGSQNCVDANNESSTPKTINSCNTNRKSNKNAGANRDSTTAAITFMSVAANKNSRNKRNYIDRKDSGFYRINDRNVNRSCNNGSNGNFASFLAPGFGFSPRSVLQGGTIKGCSSSGFDFSTVIETELQRCRRTDGKKWRCSGNVVPEMKYCEQHMHRGAKKLLAASESVTVAVAPPSITSTCAPPPLAITKKVDSRINLNTDLSISIATSPRQMTDNENSSSRSSSSDATTITDENTSLSHIFAQSP